MMHVLADTTSVSEQEDEELGDTQLWNDFDPRLFLWPVCLGFFFF